MANDQEIKLSPEAKAVIDKFIFDENEKAVATRQALAQKIEDQNNWRIQRNKRKQSRKKLRNR